jgi:uncharacterized protein
MSEDKISKNVKNSSSVLITGGSGLIGKHLTSLLLSAGYSVSHLSRKPGSNGNVRMINWDPAKKIIDHEAIRGIDSIIHLAGANIGEKRWFEARKDEILTSRYDSAKFLFDTIKENKIFLKSFISASATGIYGNTTSERIFNETDPAGEGFLSSVCSLWEHAADLFGNSGIRTVKIRTSVVLEKNDSALSKILMPAKFGFLVRTGSGNQYMPWIHIEDLCNIYLKALRDDNIQGAYNATASQHVTHREFMKVLGRVIKKPVFPVSVPAFVLKAVLGEMSEVILCGSRVSSEKIIASGYKFQFGTLEEAFKDVLK